MKLKYTGKVVKTINYAESKYLYLIPGNEYEISNMGYESERIQALIKTHELKIIPVQAGPPLQIDIKETIEDIIKNDTKKSKKKGKRSISIKKKIKDMIKSKRKRR